MTESLAGQVPGSPDPIPGPSHPAPRRGRRVFTPRSILAVSILGLGVAAMAVGMQAEPRFIAKAMVQVLPSTPRVLFTTEATAGAAQDPATDYKTFQKTQEALIRSALVINA